MITKLNYLNKAETTLAASAASGATTITVTDGSVFPTSGEYYITVWNSATYPNPNDDASKEIILCTARTNNALTVTRGQDGTSAQNLSNGASAQIRLNAANLTRIWQGILDCPSLTPTGTRNVIQPVAGDAVPLTIKGHADQSENLLNIQTSAAANVLSLNTVGDLTLIDGAKIIVGTSTGLKIGTATTQKLGFFNKAPVVQPATVTAANVTYTAGNLDTEAEIITAFNSTNTTLNDLLTKLKSLGLIA